jgi:multidrug resistance efflux pump
LAPLIRDDAALKQAQMDLTRYQTLAQQMSIPRQTATSARCHLTRLDVDRETTALLLVYGSGAAEAHAEGGVAGRRRAANA